MQNSKCIKSPDFKSKIHNSIPYQLLQGTVKTFALTDSTKKNNVINLNTLTPVSIANLHNPTLIVAPLNVKEKIILVKKSL